MFWRQLYLLLWKNFLLRKRHWLRTLIEVVWPLFLFSILIAIRKTQPIVTETECHYPARAMPSAGIFPWFKSILCDIQNPCFSTMVPSETPGQVNPPTTNSSNTTTSLFTSAGTLFTLLNSNTTLVSNLSQITSDLQTLANLNAALLNQTASSVPLSDLLLDASAYRNFLLTNMSLSSDSVDALLSANVTLAQAIAFPTVLSSGVIVCNDSLLAQALTLPTSPSTMNATAVSNELCSLTDAQRTELSQYTGNSFVNTTTLTSSFQTVDPAQILAITNNLAGYGAELQAIQAPLTALLQDVQGLQTSSLFSFLNSPADFSNFCDHPEVRNTGISQFLPQSNSNSSSATPLSGLFASYNSSSFCTNLIGTFENNTQYSFLWDVIKPLLLGKIPYSPNTDLVKSIIARANTTFETLAVLQTFGETWQSTLGPNLYQTLETGNTTSSLRTLLSSNDTLNQLSGLFNISALSLQQLRDFLSNDDNPDDSVTTWKDLYRQLDGAIVIITKLVSCFELNKFEGFNDENALVDYSLGLANSNNLWGSVVFLSPSATDDSLPNVVKYKIRQDAATVTRTTSVQRYFWRPGAESGTNRVKYYINGFVHIQDIIENAVVETALSSDSSSLTSTYDMVFGKYLQGMPYPCYTRDSYWKPEAHADYSDDMEYYTRGFLFLQDIVERALTEEILSNIPTDQSGAITWNPMSYPGAYMQEFPYPCYTYDEFLEYLSGLLSLLMTLAWVYSVCVIIKSIVYEKEQRLKEVMKMMGLSNGVHWTAWFINSFVVMFCSIILLLVILKVGDVIPYSNAFIALLWLCSFAFATITQCFLISCFFTRANLAAACGGIIYFLLYIPYNMTYAFDAQMTFSTKLVACLLSTVAFGYGATYMSQYEMSGDGIQFSNWNTSPDPSNQLTFLISMIMMLVDAVIYMTLTWYIENVFPGTYGVPRPWYFFLTKSYWCGSSGDHGGFNDLVEDDEDFDPALKLEAEPDHLNMGVSIHQLRKVYGNGKVAVDDLSLNFYEGQITSFLGHNGAGKTTTMSMLTGLFTPTSGTARIYGSDIRSEMDQIRHQLGFCPQHNVLFGDLTVMEHLEFYSGLKSAAGRTKMNKEETERMLVDVGLPHKRNEISSHLSGGMKRKLSVAVAFVGNSKCVILDEPTAGVDPYARRAIWDLLLRYRSNRTIILSTHHMDEADLLGDRIAIISHGKLKCCGSSLFLKSCFGVGYYLTVVKSNDGKKGMLLHDDCSKDSDKSSIIKSESDSSLLKKSDDLKLPPDYAKESDDGFVSASVSTASMLERSSSTSVNLNPMYDAQDVMKFAQIPNLVLKTIPNAKLQEENPREMTFILPYSAQAEGRYSDLFLKLDNHDLSYGLTDTTLEEIFLSVAEESKDDGKEEKTKCCFCIPHGKSSVTPSSPEQQARFGSLKRLRSSSYSSDFSSDYYPSSSLVRKNNKTGEDMDLDGLSEGAADDGSQGKGSYQVSGKRLVWQQFKALFVKRFHNSRRNRKGIVAQVIVPAVFVALALLFALVTPATENYPPLELQPWMYGDTNTFYSNDMPNSNLSNEVSNALLNDPGIGMRCVNQYSVLNYNDKYITCENVQGSETWTPHSSLEGYSQNITSNETLVCECTDKETRVLLAECPVGAGGEPTPRVLTQTSDWMYNMSGRNLSDWLVKTVDRFIQLRFGGLSIGEQYFSTITADQITPLVQLAETNSNFSLTGTNSSNTSVAALIESFARSDNAKVWFDNNGFHSMPTWLNILNNAALRSNLPSDKNPKDYGISVINHPLNFTQTTVDLAALSQSITDTLVSISVIFALSFIPASFVLFLIEEKVTKSKHLQFVSGVNQSIYWIANFLWDMINYIFPIIIVLFIFLAFQTKAYVSADNFPCLVCLLLLYGFSITPMMYPASFYFEVPSTAYVVLTCVNLFIGINTSIATFIMEALDDENLKYINETYLKKLFLIFPQYCLGRGLIDMSLNQAYADAYASFGIDNFTPPFAFDLVGRNLMAMAIEGVVFFALTLLIQYRFFVKPRVNQAKVEKLSYSADSDQDEDVIAERQRMLKGDVNDILQIKNLTKVYKKNGSRKELVAVNKLCVGVPEAECFGLLGVNGAGKTTTFKMLTGDETPTAGDAVICGQSILEDIRNVQQNTGYCPQFEALCSLLTGREHLLFYAKLRGVPPEDTDRVADWAVNRFGLTMYANKPAGTYSGGNKRKLSAAIAFIGCPPIVFLDEPTAGMDPVARRFLWGRISEAVRGGRCIVLTSHSMEECEVLCTRLAIMVNGKLKCLGSPQHLKNRYGEGYTVTIKVGGLDPDLLKVETFINSSFPNAILKESHYNTAMYQLPLEETKLSYLFSVIESNKQEMNIEDYSVSQTTLDEVFVSFAKNQTDGLEDEYGLQSPDPVAHDNVNFNVDYVIPLSEVDKHEQIPESEGIVMQNMDSSYLKNNGHEHVQNVVEF